jgi:hypothetical protein
MTPLIIISVVVLLAGCTLWYFARQSAAALDLPGNLAYADEADNRLLVSDRFGLTGRPDRHVNRRKTDALPKKETHLRFATILQALPVELRHVSCTP